MTRSTVEKNMIIHVNRTRTNLMYRTQTSTTNQRDLTYLVDMLCPVDTERIRPRRM
jgi:hypothetical protein